MTDQSLFWPFLATVLLGAALLVGWYAESRSRRRLDHKHQELEKKIFSLENQLNQGRRMEAVGLLAGSIIHNLNNLMAVILGHTRLALQELPEEGELREEIERVAKAGVMASDLIKEINDFYRQADQALKPTDLCAVIQDTLKMLQDILPPTVTIREEIFPNCGPVMASPTGVQQVLMNLCSNSLQSMHNSQGTIDISLKEEKIDKWHRAIPQDLGPGSYLKLTFRDNGKGMDQSTLDRMFESYFSGAQNGSKMGIGLNTVYRILQQHDGVTIPQSAIGQGTRFDIYFPLIAWQVPTIDRKESADDSVSDQKIAQDPLFAEAASQWSTENQPRATILLVDDEEMVAHVLGLGLKRLGFRVVTHLDSRQALADFAQTPEIFDIVITDQIMPHMSGVLLTKRIHAVRSDIPVILTTGFRDSFNEQQAREAGVQEFVLKPTSHRDLADLIDRVMVRQASGRG